MARELEFDQVVADKICEEIADRRSLRSVCKDEGMPAKSTVFKWLAAVPSFADQYARAREAQADSHADDIIDIADDPRLDAQEKRVRIDARKWLAGKQRPKVYGDSSTHRLTGADGGPVQFSSMTEAEIDARLAALTGGSQPAAADEEG